MGASVKQRRRLGRVFEAVGERCACQHAHRLGQHTSVEGQTYCLAKYTLCATALLSIKMCVQHPLCGSMRAIYYGVGQTEKGTVWEGIYTHPYGLEWRYATTQATAHPSHTE
ncbi:hypothetical protein DdX_10388 [Ditylenchus destructor]|uniref:Uncharacterized protein n=1 Tax=Ditylenchus destructor TaxID=166010 RepID=A0AAD4MYZ1_9BILA|nr:hypothetical protein DdX_10388 [Ditylenchus destructor]